MMRKFDNNCFAAMLLVALVFVTSCAKDQTGDPAPKPPTGDHADLVINQKMDQFLKSHYLWNGEYKTLSPDFALGYQAFLSKTLINLKTNTLDKKSDGEGGYRLYSTIKRTTPVGKAASAPTTRGVNHGLEKESVNGFGFVNFVIFTFKNSSDMALGVLGVYPDSPADKAGIKRGFMILEIDGVAITKSNVDRLYTSLMRPDGAKSVALTENAQGRPTKSITATSMTENPVVYAARFTPQPQKQVGYLVYAGFDAAYDDEVLKTFAQFKTEGIADLILDLRLNGGGHVISAQMISSCIAGSACNGKVFQYYRYNDERMAKPAQTTTQTGNAYDQAKQKFYDNFIYGSYYGVDLKSYALNLPRLYVLTSSSTASASEAVIGALKGINIPVVLIGAKSNGKNVGMEVKRLADASYNYEFAPISFQGYNAKVETVSPTGIAPDYVVSEWDNFYEFGNPDEALLAKALSLISGTQKQSRTADTRALQRVDGVRVLSAEVSGRPYGMIALPGDEQ